MLSRLKSIYTLTDVNYDISPDVHFLAMKLPFHYPALTRYFWINLYICVLILCVELGCFVTTEMNLSIFFQHGFAAVYLYKGVAASVMLLSLKDVYLKVEIQTEQLQWPLTSLKPQIKDRIRRRGRLQSIVMNSIFLLTVAYYFSAVTRELKKSFIMVYMSHLGIPMLSSLTYSAYIVILFPISYCVVFVFLNLIVFFITENELQIFLLCNYLRELREHLKSLYKKEDKNYDKKVDRYLRKIYHRHLALKQIYLDYSRLFQVSAMYYLPNIILFNIYVMYATVKGNISMVTVLFQTAIFIIYTWVAVHSGQLYEDQWRHYFTELCNLPWYNFNIKNRKSYLLILQGSSKITQIILVNGWAVNHDFGMELGKFMYTLGNCMYNIQKK